MNLTTPHSFRYNPGLLLTGLLYIFSFSVFAQSNDEYNHFEGFVGYSYNNVDTGIKSQDLEEFPELVDMLARRFPKRSRMQNAPEAQGDLHYLDVSENTEEIERLKRSVKAAGPFVETFMTAPSPGIVSTTMLNAHYPSQEAYLMAIAREMSKEYKAIHDAGLVLQIDSPDLAMDRSMFYRDASEADFVKAKMSVARC